MRKLLPLITLVLFFTGTMAQTITDFPWEEDFTGLSNGEIPEGWTRDVTNWGAFASNNAGGTAPEMNFWWQPVIEGEFYLKSPKLNTTGFDKMLFSFKHKLKNFGSPGIYTLKVVSIVGDDKYLIHEWVDPDNIGPEELSFVLTSADHGIGSDELVIAWVFNGKTDNLSQWDLDDVYLGKVPGKPLPLDEDFSGLANGEIPVDWERDVTNWGAFSSNNAGGTAPEMNFWWQPVIEGTFYLKSPGMNTDGFDELLLSFRHKLKNFGDPGIYTLKVVSLAGGNEYLIHEWVDPANIDAEQLSFTLTAAEHGVGDDELIIAWVFNGKSDNLSQWDLDDVFLGEAPQDPVLVVTPDQHDFGMQQIGMSSASKEFTILNDGGGILTIGPGDISISGTNASAFVLNNLAGDEELEASETATFSVAFSPSETGLKEAVLQVGAKEIPLTGTAIDATVSTFPWEEDFTDLSDGAIPTGWSTDRTNWGAWNTANALGVAPEMRFFWQPVFNGSSYLKSPPINTSGYDKMLFSFKHRLNNYGDPGVYTVKLVTIVGEDEYLIKEWVDPASIAAEEPSFVLTDTDHGIGADGMFIAWKFDGASDNISQWYFDDVLLDEAPSEPVLSVSPEEYDFGLQEVGTSSDEQVFTISNTGGGTLSIGPANISITGTDATSFTLSNLTADVELEAFETATFSVAFAPETEGDKTATLQVADMEIPLSGKAVDIPIFVYCDFTITEGDRDYTNVAGFREIPGYAQDGSLIATDVAGGEYGGKMLKMEYDLSLTNTYAIYYMWAYPYVNMSEYNHMVLYVKADAAVSDVMIRMQDTSGVKSIDGESFKYIDIGTEWEKITIPVNSFEISDWATNLPDMGSIQKIDIIFEKGKTFPAVTTVYVDLVGFIQQSVGIPPLDAKSGTDFRLYPNPAGTNVFVKTEPGTMITIYSITGNIVIQTRAVESIVGIDVSKLSKGMYVVKVSGDKANSMKKLMIQ